MYGVSNHYVCACFCIADHCTQYFAIVRDGSTDANDQPCSLFDFSYGEEQIRSISLKIYWWLLVVYFD